MSPTLLLMNIKDMTVLVKLFDKCKCINGVITNHNDIVVYGEPFVMDNRGPNNDELHVMMSWGEHNVSAIGTIEGHLDTETKSMIIYNKDLGPIFENMIEYEENNIN